MEKFTENSRFYGGEPFTNFPVLDLPPQPMSADFKMAKLTQHSKAL